MCVVDGSSCKETRFRDVCTYSPRFHFSTRILRSIIAYDRRAVLKRLYDYTIVYTYKRYPLANPCGLWTGSALYLALNTVFEASLHSLHPRCFPLCKARGRSPSRSRVFCMLCSMTAPRKEQEGQRTGVFGFRLSQVRELGTQMFLIARHLLFFRNET